MLKKPISIVSLASLSPLGACQEEVWESYMRPEHYISYREVKGKPHLGAWLSAQQLEVTEAIRASNPNYESVDITVLYALYAARKAFENSGWQLSRDRLGVNIGSSRGATNLFENCYETFRATGKTNVLSSPLTTLGNISSWVAQDLQCDGPEISHSITCSTSLHAVLNGVAWILSGFTDRFMVGGSEAPLTPFTIAQMQALRVYAKGYHEFPCRALDVSKTENTMVMGEGSAVACLELGKPKNAMATIIGVGYATEAMTHATSLSEEAICLQKSMKMALGDLPPSVVDVVVTHAPGTIKGDLAEVNAIRRVFGDQPPALANNKWKIGHALGASGIFNLELGVLMLNKQRFVPVPYTKYNPPKQLKTVMVNAVGFGVNAVSILISSPK